MSDTTETETETNTDTTDEPSKAELHERVEQLESTVAKMMPSRRDALKLGAAGIAGAAGLRATSGSADASTGSAGTIGSSSDRPDAFLDEANVNQLTGVSTGGIKTKTRAFLSTSSSAQTVPFDSVSYDPDNNFDTSTHEYTVPATGTYQMTFNVRLSSVSTGSKCIFQLQVNGSPIAVAEIESTGEFPTATATDIRELTTGDSITVINDNGRALQSRTRETYMCVIRLE